MKDDYISRQAAIIVIENSGLDDDSKDTAVRVLEQLPSAQPVNYRSTKSDSSSQLKLNNDLISRQALCEYALNQKDKSVTPNDIMRFPSAQPQCKKGKWITVNGRLGNEVECDKCHSVFWYWMGNYRFCPSCGARMDGENE